MLDKSDEIRSTIRGIMGDSVPKPRPSDVAMPSLSIDIGGINPDNIILTIGFIMLILSLISFTIATMLESS